MRGGGSTPTDLRPSPANRTIPQGVPNISIYDKGSVHPEVYPGPFMPELLRIPLLGTWVNKGRNRCRLAASQIAPTADKRLCFLDERQQVLQRRVNSSRASPA